VVDVADERLAACGWNERYYAHLPLGPRLDELVDSEGAPVPELAVDGLIASGWQPAAVSWYACDEGG
jgi:hypothetical protein